MRWETYFKEGTEHYEVLRGIAKALGFRVVWFENAQYCVHDEDFATDCWDQPGYVLVNPGKEPKKGDEGYPTEAIAWANFYPWQCWGSDDRTLHNMKDCDYDVKYRDGQGFSVVLRANGMKYTGKDNGLGWALAKAWLAWKEAEIATK